MSKYDPKISHQTYDTFRNVYIIELNNSLDDLVNNCIEAVKGWFEYEIENKELKKEDDLTLDCLIDSINYNGDLDSIIDTEVPIYTHEIRNLFFINEDALIEAFESMGLGSKDSPNFKEICIYSYLSENVNYWLSESLEDWFNTKFWELE